MREVKRKMKPELFDDKRLEQIEGLRDRMDNYRILFDGEDRALIEDALKVHAALIKMFKEGKK